MESKMNKEDRYKEAFNKLIVKQTPENRVIYRQHGIQHEFVSVNEPEDKSKFNYYINVSFYPDKKTSQESYDTHCQIRTRDVPYELLKDIFEAQNYNYELVEKAMVDCFKVGQSFSFFNSMQEIKNIKLHDSFDYGFDEPRITVKNVSKSNLASFLKPRNDGKPLNKVASHRVEFFVSDDNEIHPILYLTIPYCSSSSFMVKIYLHPSQKESQLENLELQINDFKKLLEDHLDFLLNKRMKLTRDEISRLTLEEKLNYIPILEMNSI